MPPHALPCLALPASHAMASAACPLSLLVLAPTHSASPMERWLPWPGVFPPFLPFFLSLRDPIASHVPAMAQPMASPRAFSDSFAKGEREGRKGDRSPTPLSSQNGGGGDDDNDDGFVVRCVYNCYCFLSYVTIGVLLLSLYCNRHSLNKEMRV